MAIISFESDLSEVIFLSILGVMTWKWIMQ